MGNNIQETLILLKPETIERKLMGKVISRFENKGFEIVKLKLVIPTTDLIKQHYIVHKDKPFYEEVKIMHGLHDEIN